MQGDVWHKIITVKHVKKYTIVGVLFLTVYLPRICRHYELLSPSCCRGWAFHGWSFWCWCLWFHWSHRRSATAKSKEAVMGVPSLIVWQVIPFSVGIWRCLLRCAIRNWLCLYSKLCLLGEFSFGFCEDSKAKNSYWGDFWSNLYCAVAFWLLVWWNVVVIFHN